MRKKSQYKSQPGRGRGALEPGAGSTGVKRDAASSRKVDADSTSSIPLASDGVVGDAAEEQYRSEQFARGRYVKPIRLGGVKDGKYVMHLPDNFSHTAIPVPPNRIENPEIIAHYLGLTPEETELYTAHRVHGMTYEDVHTQMGWRRSKVDRIRKTIDVKVRAIQRDSAVSKALRKALERAIIRSVGGSLHLWDAKSGEHASILFDPIYREIMTEERSKLFVFTVVPEITNSRQKSRRVRSIMTDQLEEAEMQLKLLATSTDIWHSPEEQVLMARDLRIRREGEERETAERERIHNLGDADLDEAILRCDGRREVLRVGMTQEEKKLKQLNEKLGRKSATELQGVTDYLRSGAPEMEERIEQLSADYVLECWRLPILRDQKAYRHELARQLAMTQAEEKVEGEVIKQLESLAKKLHTANPHVGSLYGSTMFSGISDPVRRGHLLNAVRALTALARYDHATKSAIQ